MRIKHNIALSLLLMLPLPAIQNMPSPVDSAQAQQLKQFSLEDLNFGGTNYRNMIPANMYLTWWGDRLMYQDAEEWGTVDMKTGCKTKVATLEEVNKTLQEGKIRSAMSVRFPYPDRTLALLGNSRERILYNWAEGKVEWRQPCEGETESNWNTVSKAVAFVRDNQLCVTDAKGNTKVLTKDGSREIVYGQAVHRNEFGIMKGIFWNADGTKFAFYRMDQTMVTDYPQVNTFTRVAEEEPDKYPMAGMTSHKVTVGIYDMAADRTVYLDAGDPTDRYFTNIAWNPDGKTVYMFAQPRPERLCPCELRCSHRQPARHTLSRNERKVCGAAESDCIPAMGQHQIHHPKPTRRLQPSVSRRRQYTALSRNGVYGCGLQIQQIAEDATTHERQLHSAAPHRVQHQTEINNHRGQCRQSAAVQHICRKHKERTYDTARQRSRSSLRRAVGFGKCALRQIQ